MNRKGFTVVELIVSFALTMIVAVFLFRTIISLKDSYVGSGIKSQLLNKQTLMSSKINNDFYEKGVKIALRCGKDCLNFIFNDNTSSKLIVDRDNNLFTYGDYNTKLVDGSEYGSVDIHSETTLNVESGKSDSFIVVKIPIKHPLLKDDYGVNIIYQYDSRTSAISNVVMDETTTSEELVVLKGSKTMYQPATTTYVEPGYYVVRADGTVTDTDPKVTITGTVGTTVGTTYTLTYTLKNSSNVVTSVKTRNVIITQSIYNFVYTGASQTFTAPQNGLYQVELWGGQGGTSKYNTDGTGASIPGGNGAYTVGTISLTTGYALYVYVGGVGANGVAGVNAAGGYNGGAVGGKAYQGASGGGGATDIRLTSGLWNDVSGLRSRIMVAGGGSGASNWVNAITGGYGGGLFGGPGLLNTGAVAHTLAGGGIQTSGGTAGLGGSAGSFGAGGNSEGSHGGGGGSGYYGGGGGGVTGNGVSSGAGGSSFISGYPGVNAINSSGTHTNQPIHYSGLSFSGATMLDGVSTMPIPAGGNEVGHTGNGYARIKLISIVNDTYQVPETHLASVDVLVVAGGGGGGGRHGGGGGAGGFIETTINNVATGTYNITIGNGGTGSSSDSAGANGGNSTAFGLTAIGGGGGGSWDSGRAGYAGGSGGGASWFTNGGSGTYFSAGTLGQGNSGGIPEPDGYGQGAGGGGAGGPGENAVNNVAGSGGAGKQSSILGTSYYFAAGGGGGAWGGTCSLNGVAPKAGNGGIGGAGGGGFAAECAGTIGLGSTGGLNPGGNGISSIRTPQGGDAGANTGSGGGGGGANNPNTNAGIYYSGRTGGNGGSGIVVIRYSGAQKASGGIVTSVGGYTIHTFTSGTSVFNVW